MLDVALSQLVASAVADAQRPLVAALAEVCAKLADVQRQLGELTQAAAQRPGNMVYLNVAQVAERLGVCTRTVKRWVDTGALPHVRLPGGGIRFSVAELERVLHRAEAGLEAAE